VPRRRLFGDDCRKRPPPVSSVCAHGSRARGDSRARSMGPEGLRVAGINAALTQRGLALVDCGNSATAKTEADQGETVIAISNR